MRTNLVAAAVGVTLLIGGAAHAQTAPAPRRYFALKGGANVEHADDVHGTSAGVGAVVGGAISDRWAVEGEFWLPSAIHTDPEQGRHRDTLLSVGFRRAFRGGAVTPHLVVGATLVWTDDRFTTCLAMRQHLPSTPPIPTLVSCDEPDVVQRRLERFSGLGLSPLVGAGVEIAVSRRVRLIPEVRVQAAVTANIIRPAIAVGIVF